MKRIAFVCTARASWGSLLPVLRVAKGVLDPVVVVAASALDARYGRVLDWDPGEYGELVTIDTQVGAGRQHGSMVKTSALTAQSMVDMLQHVAVDGVYVVGDRHEVMGAAQAAAYTNTPLYHAMGGERSGSVDDRVRGAITAMADVHFAATKKAGQRIAEQRGSTHGVYVTGCPRLDEVDRALAEKPQGDRRVVMVSIHPDTHEKDMFGKTLSVLEALPDVAIDLFWPNADAGSEMVVEAIRAWTREGGRCYTHRRMQPDDYYRFLRDARVLVGNSSSGIREGSYIGTPVVNVGDRQAGRERAANVVDVGYDTVAVGDAIRSQLDARYDSSDLYGDGKATERIMEVLCGC